MESVETVNSYLRETFGIDSITGQPMYRVVWADDQYEKRLTKYTDTGIELLQPEVRELPKYQHSRGYYILEHLVLIPLINKPDLPAQQLSYEPLYTFMDRLGNPLPPAIWASKFVIDVVNAAMGKGSLAHYVGDNSKEAPITSHKQLYERRKAEIDQIENELFGDESSLGYTTVTGESIIVPRNYERKN